MPRAGLHVLCGHLHPLAALPGLRRRWPAFWLRQRLTVLPAFSAFTGGHRIDAGVDDRFVVCAGDALVAVGGD